VGILENHDATLKLLALTGQHRQEIRKGQSDIDSEVDGLPFHGSMGTCKSFACFLILYRAVSGKPWPFTAPHICVVGNYINYVGVKVRRRKRQYVTHCIKNISGSEGDCDAWQKRAHA
jgi:hypothetical protein